MLNSQNYATDKEIIRSGEVVAGVVPGKPGSKTYFHQVAGACTYLNDGVQVVFSGGQYSTDNKDVIRHLDGICDKPGTLVFSHKPGTPISKEHTDLALEVAEPAGNSADNVGKVHATGQQAAQLNQQVKANAPNKSQAVDEKLVDAQK